MSPTLSPHRRDWLWLCWDAGRPVIARRGSRRRQSWSPADFRSRWARVFLNEETVTDGVADGTALVVELEITNRGTTPFQLNPGQIWCTLQIDTRHPDETRMFPPVGQR